MKTGRNLRGGEGIRPFPDSFYISLLCLQAILKRNGFSDAIVYRKHNSEVQLDNKVVDSGIIFNLYSDWGVGKKLEPLIREIFINYMIDYEKNKGNPFVEEIINLSQDAINVIRQGDTKQEIMWCYIYSIKSFLSHDGIADERDCRLKPLFISSDFYSDNLYNNLNYSGDIIDEIEDDFVSEIEEKRNEGEGKEKIIVCECKFCLEFRKYINYCKRGVDSYIIEALQDIDRQISMEAKTTKVC